MYNFDDDTLPTFLPVSEGALLKPWFEMSLLDKGLQLIRDKTIGDFHCLRNATGALLDGETPVTLQFKKSTRLYQDFFIQSNHCSYCRLESNKKRCEHMAALAILSLTPSSDQNKSAPIPFSFAQSCWAKIGLFLYEWLTKTQYSIKHSINNRHSSWEITTATGGLQMKIPAKLAPLGEQLLQQKTKNPDTGKISNKFTLLNDELHLLTMTETERALLNAGSNSIGWQKDTSFWIWLAKQLYLIHGDILPNLSREPETSRFVLRTNSKENGDSFSLFLPQDKTWEMVRNIYTDSKQISILPSAKECFRASFTDDNILEISPCLRLKDGRVLSRQGLAKDRFQSAYYLDGEGFLPTTPIPAEGTFIHPSKQTESLPLLSFMQKKETRNEPFYVAPNDLPIFLEANQKPLQFTDNIIDPKLKSLHVQELPDQLVIDSFAEQDDWCYLSCHYGLGNTQIHLQDIITARDNNLSCLPGRQWLQLEDTPMSWLYDLLKERCDSGSPNTLRLSYREMMALTALTPNLKINIENNSSLNNFRNLLDTDNWTDDSSLSLVPEHLRSYQRNGLAWLSRLYRLGIGGLLADDMGLGKTHQGLALLQAVANTTKDALMLVVCPASVVLNWADKIEQFFKDLNYTIYYGTQRSLETVTQGGILLTTYGIVRQDVELLCSFPFDIIILDEIQNLKNQKTAVHKAVATINGKVKIGLTGTPVENSLQDLRSLFDICLPGLLGSERQFERMYVGPITEGHNIEVRERLGRLINPFILRRTRTQVLTELPDVIENNRICELSDDQIALYREVLEEREFSELERAADEQTTVPYVNILATITRLKQICCHPCLIQGCSNPEEYQSGKWDQFMALSEELLEADMKFVVFSQYTSMIDLIETHLQKIGMKYSSLKGNMVAGKRQQMIKEFNNNPDCRIFCASLLAGGVGIDLTSAHAVIHYDRWWNPAKEEQATARVHRMGQKSVVQVFRLITRGTLEEKIHQLIEKKQELASSLIHEDEAGIIKQMDRKQLAELFQYTPVN